MAQDKDSKNLNVPPLRFPGFTDEWKRLPISIISDILCGYAFEGNSIVEYETPNKLLRGVNITEGIIRHSNDVDRFISGEIGRKLDKYILQSGDLVIGMDGSKVGRNSAIICEEDSGSYLVQRVCRLRANFTITSLIFHQVNNPKFHKYVDNVKTSSAIPHISQSDISKYIVSLSTNTNENSKIAKLLNCIDERIATQNKIIEDLKKLKSAIIDYTFGDKKYSHRKRVLLSDVSVKITRRNSDNHIFNVLSNSANYGIIPQSEVFEQEIANENNTSNYFVISKNDFVYNPRKSVTAPYGPINRYNGETAGVISPLYLCFRCYGLDVEYLGWYFKSDSWHKYVYQNGDTGVRHDRVSIKDDIFFSMPLFIHNADEQIEIAKRLNKIESFVKQEEQYLFLLESQKLYLLQQMFI